MSEDDFVDDFSILVPRVGIGGIIHDDNGRALFSFRNKPGKPGDKMAQLVGGHLEMYETFEQCFLRESKEEVSEDIVLEDIWVVGVTNNPWPELEKHYVTVFLAARYVSGSIQGLGGHGPWFWGDLANPPQPLFESSAILTPANIAKIKNRRG